MSSRMRRGRAAEFPGYEFGGFMAIADLTVNVDVNTSGIMPIIDDIERQVQRVNAEIFFLRRLAVVTLPLATWKVAEIVYVALRN